jgi:hypothetical protein
MSHSPLKRTFCLATADQSTTLDAARQTVN